MGRRGALAGGTGACLPGDCTCTRVIPFIAIDPISGAAQLASAATHSGRMAVVKFIPLRYTLKPDSERKYFTGAMQILVLLRKFGDFSGNLIDWHPFRRMDFGSV